MRSSYPHLHYAGKPCFTFFNNLQICANRRRNMQESYTYRFVVARLYKPSHILQHVLQERQMFSPYLKGFELLALGEDMKQSGSIFLAIPILIHYPLLTSRPTSLLGFYLVHKFLDLPRCNLLPTSLPR